MNTGKLEIGSFCLSRNRGELRWYVQFKLPEGQRSRESSKLKQCDRCLADPRAIEKHANCACQKDARAWAAARLDELALAWKTGRLQQPSARVLKGLTLGDIRPVYLERGPADRADNLRSLALVVAVAMNRHGDKVWQTRLDELHPDQWDQFAWCYQQYEKRGWTKRGQVEVPADAWTQIWWAMPNHPDPDRDSATPGNTTIISTMRKAKSVLGPESRDSYLKPLRERFPESLAKWWGTKINITVADNRFSLSADVYARMWQALPALKQDDPQAWALIRLHWTTGVRPIEASQARATWLEQDADNNVLLVIKNRPAEGFYMKDRTTKQERPWPLAADLVEMLPRLVSAAGSLLGCDTAHEWDKVYRRANAWLREMGVEGSQTLYNLRKLVATVKVANEGADAAAAALGHSKAQTTLEHYVGQSGPIKAITDEELSPESVMGMQRRPFVLLRQGCAA